MRVFAFLFSTFISGLGDTLLVYSIPTGLGLENQDIRMAIFMWFIPAIAMYSSSYFYKRISARVHHARKDYAYLLLALAIIEIITASLTLKFNSPIQTLVLSCIFVYFYAFAKEGLPKIFYDVQVYRFFVSDDGYARLAGQSNALGIVAKILGGVMAAGLIAMGSWKWAFFIDAMTFLLFALAIFIFGKDAKSFSNQKMPEVPVKEITNQIKQGQLGKVTGPVVPEVKTLVLALNVIVPLLFAFNALSWNYITLIAQKLNVSDVSAGILLLTIMQLPGLIIGAQFEKFKGKNYLKHFVVTIPVLFFLSVITFLIFPNKILFFFATLLFGLVSGLLWPSERYIKSHLETIEMISTNNTILRRLSSFQFFACVLAFIIYSFPKFQIAAVISSLALSGVIFMTRKNSLTISSLVRNTFACMLLFGISSCTPENSEKRSVVLLPSLSKDFRLRPELTYSAMAIINDTSAHVARVSKKLALEGQVLKNYQASENGKSYTITLDENYKSARNESIDASDVEFTIKWYLINQKGLASQFLGIDGSHSCVNLNCEISGIRQISKFQLQITLSKVDRYFIDALTSPWVILFKKDRPLIETIGTCQVPYQTGTALIKNCTNEFIEMDYSGKSVFVYDEQDYNEKGSGEENVARLLTTSPEKKQYASLTVMSAFANPESTLVSSVERTKIFSNIRSVSKALSQELSLSYSPTITPKWLSIKVPDNLLEVEATPIKCPKKPISILLDSSLPDHDVLKKYLGQAIGCPVTYNVTNADQYFVNFKKNDLGVAWFSPDFLNVYNIFSIFDCVSGMCYFDWKDKALQSLIDSVKASVEQGTDNLVVGSQIEDQIFKKGYAAPIADMNWWIKKDDKVEVIHQAGLFQIRIGDFL